MNKCWKQQKRCFNSEQEATTAMLHVARVKKLYRGDTYKCPFCHKWHFTSKRPAHNPDVRVALLKAYKKKARKRHKKITTPNCKKVKENVFLPEAEMKKALAQLHNRPHWTWYVKKLFFLI